MFGLSIFGRFLRVNMACIHKNGTPSVSGQRPARISPRWTSGHLFTGPPGFFTGAGWPWTGLLGDFGGWTAGWTGAVLGAAG
jgi:hypothetical protein